MHEHELIKGMLYRFADFPNGKHAVPEKPGVYTVWHEDRRFLYVGKATTQRTPATRPGCMKGLRDRLDSHYHGAVTEGLGLQIWCMLIEPVLTHQERRGIRTGSMTPLAKTRAYVRSHLSYRFCAMDLEQAKMVETRFRSGETSAGRPVLNPIPRNRLQSFEQPTAKADCSATRRFLAVYELGEGNLSGFLPDLPGVIVTAATLEAMRAAMREAAEFHLEGLAADGDPIPEPARTSVDFAEEDPEHGVLSCIVEWLEVAVPQHQSVA